ncbi:Hypothetical protein NTJ_14000 [Nesidiocoris tenuis]|uniref:Uncharacterized protein n=1 Tax=Nesidiocoris tenuis TaxID=355587 RepID=A0ABN7BA89_9HEMI|nr:Hypothetical protein NTJ_14000 [Nesidiocoris tenuis]
MNSAGVPTGRKKTSNFARDKVQVGNAEFAGKIHVLEMEGPSWKLFARWPPPNENSDFHPRTDTKGDKELPL